MGRIVVFAGHERKKVPLCKSATKGLRVGKRYELVSQTNKGEITLKGVEGTFNISQFKDTGEQILRTKVRAVN